jgi:hypothetical protein
MSSASAAHVTHPTFATQPHAAVLLVAPAQTETPEMLAERNRERKAAKQKAASVVRREAVAVLSPATLTDPAMTLAQPDAAWVLAGEGRAAGWWVWRMLGKGGPQQGHRQWSRAIQGGM